MNARFVRKPSTSSGSISASSNMRFAGSCTLRVAPRPVHQVAQQQLRDIYQHQAHEDFIGMKAGAQERPEWPPRPCRPAHPPPSSAAISQGASTPMEIQRYAASSNCAHGELAFRTDVPYVGTKTDGQPQAAQNQRGGFQ